MSSEDTNLVYLSFDADSAGRMIGKAVLNDDAEEMSKVSERIELGNRLFNRWIKDRDGKVYSSGGDQGVYSLDEKYVEELEQLRVDYKYLTDLTVSIGVGKRLSESGQALLMAKLKGKDQIVFFDKKTKQEIKEIKKRAKKGAFKSMEEYKLAGAYLEKGEQIADPECPYCEQTDGIDTDHCKWCHDLQSANETQCPYCLDNAAQASESPEIGEQDCPFCKEMDQKGECTHGEEKSNSFAASPDSINASAPAGSQEERDLYAQMDMNAPEIGKPELNDHPPVGQNPPMDSDGVDPESVEPRLNVAHSDIDPEDNHSKAALTAIATQIETEGSPTQKEVNAVDDTALPVSQAVEQNVSRPEDYGQNLPQDMGMGGPNPPAEQDNGADDTDYSSVLEEGLEAHSDGIQKEKTIQLVSQALVQFKGCKDILENAKLQTPQLYQASISMLRAMIEMASMLGLGAGESAPALGEQQAAITPEAPQNEWHDPFPTHPDHGGEPKPGHAPSKPKEEEKPPSPQQ